MAANDGDDLMTTARDGAECDRPPPLEGGHVVMRDRALRRSLKGCAMKPEARREAMQLVRIVGDKVRPP
jgi:hypothetical protein